ncbi:uncharacterized protein [Watersipora subatra]|uniref:uncharacterized protein n=1 Tax=Watersipora subatra TaxID=2589382 RepID=UPI00355B5008
MVFNPTVASPLPDHHLDDNPLEIIAETKYLGVILQSDLKFNSHIQDKISKANHQLGMIKPALHLAPEKARLLAYTSLCRFHVEYASSVWDTPINKLVQDIEMVQNTAIRYIANIKGRESITAAREKLEIDTLADRHMKIRHTLLYRILSNGENHNALPSSYDELIQDHPTEMGTARAAARGEPPTIFADKSVYHNSFLPRTVRELKSKIAC